MGASQVKQMLGGRRSRGAQRKNTMSNSFDIMAQSFDTDYRITRANTVSQRIKQEIDLINKHNILEFGCGTGLITTNIINTINQISLVDSSEGMLNQLKVKLSKLTTNKRINIYTDLFDKTIVTNSYDLIYSSMVLHHIKNIELFGNRFNTLLVKNGTLCIIDLFPVDKDYHINEPDFDGYHGFDPDWLTKQFETIGFKKDKCDVIYTDSKRINDKVINYSLFMLLMKKE
jgi:ubiquinone/menaquinone biosynthesis C-methylase UbiE